MSNKKHNVIKSIGNNSKKNIQNKIVVNEDNKVDNKEKEEKILAKTSNDVVEKIKEIIKTKIRPILVMDGGNIEFVEYKNKIVSVKLLGACNGCPLAVLTLKNTVKSMIKEAIPEVEDVEAIDFTEDELE